jgi:hypothetical protein
VRSIIHVWYSCHRESCSRDATALQSRCCDKMHPVCRQMCLQLLLDMQLGGTCRAHAGHMLLLVHRVVGVLGLLVC